MTNNSAINNIDLIGHYTCTNFPALIQYKTRLIKFNLLN